MNSSFKPLICFSAKSLSVCGGKRRQNTKKMFLKAEWVVSTKATFPYLCYTVTPAVSSKDTPMNFPELFSRAESPPVRPPHPFQPVF